MPADFDALDCALRGFYAAHDALLVAAERARAELERHAGVPGSAAAVVQRVVAMHYHSTVADLRSRDRGARTALVRQVAMALARELLPALTCERIGAEFARDHTTVLFACKSIADRRDVDRKFARDFAEVRSKCLAALEPAVRPDSPLSALSSQLRS